MRNKARHVINRVSLEVKFQDKESAFKGRGTLQDIFYKSVLPQLEKAIEKYSFKSQVIRINRLEIDLGTLPFDQSASDLGNRIYSVISDKLNRLGPGDVVVEELTRARVETYLEFLETGLFHWSSEIGSTGQFEDTFRKLDQTARTFWLARLRMLLQKKFIQTRFIYQHCDDFFYWVADQLQPLLKQAKTKFFEERFARLSKVREKEIVLECISRLPGKDDMGRLTEELDSLLANHFPKSEELAGSQPRMKDGHNIELETRRETGGASSQGPVKEEVIFIQNAGIVLLHPFFVSLFTRLGFLDNNQEFTGSETRLRAFFMLHYLACGTGYLEEHRALFYKILCAMDMHEPVPKTIALTTSEKTEAEALLISAIANWKALKNTSPGGLREAFIHREGKLQKKDKGWTLKVEQSSFDILLARLPWSLSIIKLPWLKQMIWVEWA